MIVPRLSSELIYGGDYNPEQWPESVWQEDARLMREAGVNLVSVGIFSWAKLQSNETTYDFGWLDRVLDLLAKHDIHVCLATATASPPPWMSKQSPDVLAVDASGIPYHPGSRQHYSPCSPTYRRLAAALVRKLGERYKNHPALAVWHINNEYACHVQECHGEASTRGFRAWLLQKYRTLDALNAAWGTAFWSQTYYDWDEIFTPRRAPGNINPTQQLDFKRFMSDAFLELYLVEWDILREVTPDVPITTNFMLFFKALDYRKWAKSLNFIAWDSYPDPVDEDVGSRIAAAGHDLIRSLKKDRPFVLMEQAPSAVNWRPVNRPKRPGLMRLLSLQAVARGADGVMFFQWRASRAGAEKFHSGMIQHVDHARSRVFAEVKNLGAELKKLRPVSGSVVHSRVAIAFDWQAWWAVELDSKPGHIDYAAWAQELHRYFFERNIAVDFVDPNDVLTDYALVLAPALYLLSRDAAKNLASYVQGGGVLLATYFSGIVDENEHVVLGGYPAWLREVLGLWVEEWVPYVDGQTNTVRFVGGRKARKCHHWCDLVHLEGGKALATYTGDFFAGRPAVTVHGYGKGTAYYLGTKLEAGGLAEVLDRACRQAKVSSVLKLPKKVEVTLRENNGRRFLFLLNHRSSPIALSLANYRGVNLLTGKRVTRQLKLSSLGVAVLALEEPRA